MKLNSEIFRRGGAEMHVDIAYRPSYSLAIVKLDANESI